MDMKINFLPAKTWNWLRMNETEVKQVKADRQALEKEEIPETFAVEASTLEPIKTGMGPNMDKLAEQSGFAAKAYRMPAGIKEAAALRLCFVCKDQTASLDLIDLRRSSAPFPTFARVLTLQRGTLQRENPRKGRKRRTAASRSDRLPRQRVPCFK